MENRTAFWQQISKAAGTYNFYSNSVIKVHADCPHLRQNGGKRPVRFRAFRWRKKTLVHKVGSSSYAPYNRTFSPSPHTPEAKRLFISLIR